MEQKLFEWVLEERQKKLSVSMKEISDRARIFFSECYPLAAERFSASHGWFSKFVTRFNLSRRSPTHVVQQVRSEVEEDMKSFWKNIYEIRSKAETFREEGISKTIILNIDEVPVTLDLSQNRTYHPKGARMIEVKRIKETKLMCTVLLGVLSNGQRLPPYVVFRSNKKVEVPENLKPFIIIRNNSKGWMDSELFEDYIDRLVLNLKLSPDTHLIFVLDWTRIHTGNQILLKLKVRSNISYHFIPSGCTFFCSH